MDAEELQGWFLKFGEYSTRLYTSVKTLVGFLANGSLLCTAYRAFMSVQLIALDKQPSVHPVGIGEM